MWLFVWELHSITIPTAFNICVISNAIALWTANRYPNTKHTPLFRISEHSIRQPLQCTFIFAAFYTNSNLIVGSVCVWVHFNEHDLCHWLFGCCSVAKRLASKIILPHFIMNDTMTHAISIQGRFMFYVRCLWCILSTYTKRIPHTPIVLPTFWYWLHICSSFMFTMNKLLILIY